MKRFYRMSICLIILLFSMFFCRLFSVDVKAFGNSNVNDFLRFEEELMNLNSTMSAQSLYKENESEFSLKRLIVNGQLSSTYGAIKKVSYDNLHVLCYASEADTKYAYDMLKEKTGLSVVIDKVEKLEEYAEKEYDYSGYDNWAAESVDVGGYREFLVDNNVNKEIVVVVLDTGINTSHPMFKNRLVKTSDGKIKGFSYYDSLYRYSYDNLAFDSDDESRYSFEDDHGHGAHVSGIITSLTPENVKILTIKIGDSRGYSSTDVMIAAYLRVVNIYSKEYNVVATNLSFSGAGKNSEDERDTFNEKCYEPLLDLNILPITAAGNESDENNLDGLKAVVVSSLKQRVNEYVFDNGYSNYGKFVDISAPGTGIKSAGIAKTDGEDSSMVLNDGTSMASPQVAGVVALLYLNPNLPSNFTALDIEQMLYDNSIDLGEPQKDIYYGEGMLNLKYFEISNKEQKEHLSFYKNGVLVDKYTKYGNFENAFSLEIKCSDPSFKIIYTTDTKFPTYSNHMLYSSAINIQESIVIYAMGVKIVENEIVERTDMYYISYFYSFTPLEECFTVNYLGDLENYTCNYTHLVIPETLHGKIIKGIQPSVFKYSNLESIVLPETLTEIGGYAFQESKNLKYVYAPGVTKLYVAAFAHCSSIKFVTDEQPNESSIEGIYLPSLTEMIGYSFYDCENLESVKLSKLETFMDGRDFADCPKLSFVYLPNITSIPEQLFFNDVSLTGEFNVGEHVASVVGSAFKGTKINHFNVDKNNKYLYTDGIGLYSTSNFIAFASANENVDYEILSSVSIGGAFYNITEIDSGAITGGVINNLIIPSTITKINGGAFSKTVINNLYYNSENCSSEGYWDEENFSIFLPFYDVKTIIIGESVKTVPSRLFQEVPFERLIINSYDTKLEQSSFYRFSRSGEVSQIDQLVLNFDNQIDQSYYNMVFVNTSMFTRNDALNYLYVEKTMSSNLLNRIFKDGFYSYYINDKILYSSAPIENKFVINAFSNDFGVISNEGITLVDGGESLTYKFSPNKDYVVKDIFVDGVKISGDLFEIVLLEGYTFENVESNHEINIVFDKVSQTHMLDINQEFEESPSKNFKFEITDGLGFAIDYEYEDKFVIASVKVNGEEWDIDEHKKCYSKCYVVISDITKDLSIHVTYNLKQYTIQASLEGNGTIIPKKGDVKVKHGKDQKFEIMVSQGNYVENIYVGSGALSKDEISSVLKNGYTFTNVTGDNSIRVVIEAIKTYKIQVKVLGEGKVDSQSDLLKVVEGEDVLIKFVPAERYKVRAILIDDVYLRDSQLEDAINKGYTFENVVNDHSVTVLFNEKYYIAKVVYEYRDIILHEKETFIYNLKEEVAIVKKFDEKYRLTGLLVGGIEMDISNYLNSSGNEIFISNISRDITIRAQYEIIEYTIDAKLEGNGAITPKGNVVVAHGENQKFEIVVVQGHHIENIYIGSRALSVDEINSVLKNGYIFTNVIGDNSIRVVVVKDYETHKIYAKSEGEGTISPDGENEVIEGENQKFVFAPKEGYRVSVILIDGEYLNDELLQAAIKEGYTFENVEEEHSIKVVYVSKEVFKIEVEVLGEGIFESENDLSKVEYGSNVSIKFIPNEGYKIDKVWVDKKEVDIEDGSLEILNVISNMNIIVSFEKNNIEIDPGNITINGMSCAKGDGGSIFDFLFVVLTMLGFAVTKKKFFVK